MRAGATKNNGCKTCREDTSCRASHKVGGHLAERRLQRLAATPAPPAVGGVGGTPMGAGAAATGRDRGGGGGNCASDASMAAVHRWQTGKYQHSRAAPPLPSPASRLRLSRKRQPASRREPAPLSRAGRRVESRGYPPPRRPPSSHLDLSHPLPPPTSTPPSAARSTSADKATTPGDIVTPVGAPIPKSLRATRHTARAAQGRSAPPRTRRQRAQRLCSLVCQSAVKSYSKALLMSCRETLYRCRWWGAANRPTSTSLSAPAPPAPSTATPCCHRTPAHRQDRAGLWPPTVRCQPQPSQAPRRLHGAAGQRLTADKRRPAADRSHRVTGPWSPSAGRWRLRRQRAGNVG